jgi:hypothetical protein
MARVGSGVVTGMVEPPGTGGARGLAGTEGGGTAAPERIGTVFAVSAFNSDGSPAPFRTAGTATGAGSPEPGAIGPVVSGGGTGGATAGIGVGGAVGLGGMVADEATPLRDGIGSVRLWSARASAVRDIFLVDWTSGAVVLKLLEAVIPFEGPAGALSGETGPSGLVLAVAPSAPTCGLCFGSETREGR